MADQSLKLKLIKHNQALFKDYVKAARRAKYLRASVVLCENCVELVLFSLDEGKALSGDNAIESITRFHAYNEADLEQLNSMLNHRALTMKERWLPAYQKLHDSHSEGWGLDLTKSDYAVLVDGDSVCNAKRYRMSWSFEGIRGLMEYIADCSIPNIEEDDD